MTNIIPKKVPIGTIATAYQLNNERMYYKHPRWILLNGGGIGESNCLYRGREYRSLYDHANKILHANKKKWGADIIYIPPCLEPVGVNGTCGEIGTYSYYEQDNNTVIQRISSTINGFINNVQFGVINVGPTPPLSRELCFFIKKSGNDFQLLNKIRMDFPTIPPPAYNSYSYYTVTLPTCVYINSNTYIGVYPGLYMARNNSSSNYYINSPMNIGETKTFSTTTLAIQMLSVVTSAKPSHYISY